MVITASMKVTKVNVRNLGCSENFIPKCSPVSGTTVLHISIANIDANRIAAARISQVWILRHMVIFFTNLAKKLVHLGLMLSIMKETIQPIPSSELIINGDGSVFHLHLFPEDVADTVLLFGDQGRVEMFAGLLDTVEVRRQSREFFTVTGRSNGRRITAVSTGIGTDNIDIVMNELDALVNIDFKTRTVKSEHRRLTILRVGTCGAIQPDIPGGSVVFSEISIGFDGVLNWYSGGEKIFIKDAEDSFVNYMNWPERYARPYFVRSAAALSSRFDGVAIKGMTVSSPGFYGPQGRSVRLGLTVPDLVDRMAGFRYGNLRIVNMEMESSALVGLATLLGHDAGTVCLVLANRYVKSMNTDYKALMEDLLKKVLAISTE